MRLGWRRRRGAGQEVRGSAVGGSVISIREVAGDVTITETTTAAAGYRYWCEPWPRQVGLTVERARAQPSLLLRPDAGVVRFLGREDELTALDRWLATDDPIAVRLIHAAGGEGKSRLAREFCENATAAGWVAWRVVHTQGQVDDSGVIGLRERNAIVLVVDDAHRWPVGDLDTLITNLRGISTRDSVRVRVLLLARSSGGWWSTLSTHLSENRVPASVAGLAPLGQRFDRDQVFDTAVTGFSRALDIRDRAPNQYRVGVNLHQLGLDSVLSIHMAALAAIHSRIRNIAPDHAPAAVAAYLLDREYTDWSDRLDARTITTGPETMRRVVLLASLTGGMPYADARSLLISVGLAGDDTAATQVIDDHSRCYPAPPGAMSTVLHPLQPDRLAEDFLALTTPGNPANPGPLPPDPWTLEATSRLLRRTGNDAVPGWVSVAIVRVVEAAMRWPHLAAALLYPSLHADPTLVIDAGGPTLVRLADLPEVPAPILTEIHQHLTERPGLDTTAAATAIDTALIPRRIAATTDPAELAKLHLRHARRLADSHRYIHAVTAAEHATGLYRALADTDPGQYLHFYAAASHQLGLLSARLGRHHHALTHTQTATTIRRRLAETAPDTHLPELAGSLSNLGSRLGELGRHHEALDSVQESVAIWRRLADANPDTHLPDLARSLSNLAISLGELGRHHEALEHVQESVAIRRGLADTNPDIHLPDLASSLNTLAISLGELGRHHEALEHVQESVAIWRRLADTNPDTHLPALASSLDNLGNRLGGLGRHHEALEHVQESVAIWRRLADTNPDTHQPELVSSLSNLGILLGELGRHHEALDSVQESVAIRRRLADTNPDTHLPDLARSLNNLAISLGELGRHHEALDSVQESVAIRRRLADTNPDTHLPDLASSLNTLGVRLAALGHHIDALATIQESVAIRRGLADANPDTHLPDLARSLQNLGIRLSVLGHHHEALEPAQESVAIWRQLADTNPDSHLPSLAYSLVSFARVSAGTAAGILPGFNAIQEAINTLENLTQQLPEPHEAWLREARRINADILQRLANSQ
ncbi:tetratricopeptide repeat protein [Nocardia vinacea]|uniref:Tetratricopeptide repeat protein n=1 Tax=Nocardia vinacea TaxID=96468 RepID=A0ABZ1YNX5_9NOCA|nr:tetratricopeptide repeat protein [Nocardia vinacea]